MMNMTVGAIKTEMGAHERKGSKETIHSGHFMVSDFEADELDEEGIEIQYSADNENSIEEIQGVRVINHGGVITYEKSISNKIDPTTVSIEATLTKLFQTMSLAYRQNITCPKWNGFKGIRLRWKDKIRLNNIIWRCWHMQYIQRIKMNVCQFALDIDMENRPEAIVLEGKYWKRQTNAVTAEYRKWRLYHKSRLSGIESAADVKDNLLFDLDDDMDWSPSMFLKQGINLEESLFGDSIDLTEMLFSTTVTPQPFPFPNARELEMLIGRSLPTVPEEDLFHEVEEAAGLPPPSPPSVSTPTPGANLGYSARFTSIPGDPYPSDPSSPALFSPQDTFIPNRKPYIQPLVVTTAAPQEFSPPTYSPADVKPTEGALMQHQRESVTQWATGLESSNHHFIVPKNVPKKKLCPAGSQGIQIPLYLQTSSPVFGSHAPVNLTTTTQGCQLVTLGSSNVSWVNKGVTTPFTAPTMDSPLNFFNQDSCQVSSGSFGNSIKLSTTSPKPFQNPPTPPFRMGAAGPNEGSTSSSSSNVSPVTVPHSGSKISLLMPNVTLSPVTPSSIKGIQSSPAYDQNFIGAQMFTFKSSPSEIDSKSPLHMSGVPSPTHKPFRPKSNSDRLQYKEHRRVSHINAEQKRRCHIKNNFDLLHSLVVPSISQNPHAKVSKATMLQKGAEFIVQTKQERQQLNEQAETLRRQIEKLNADISLAQSMLPATGAPINHSRHNQIKEKFESYVRDRTLSNPKYFILSLIAEPLLDSFNSSVSTASVDDLCRSSLAWLDKHCSLNVLRPVVSNGMRKLSLSTNILTTPETLNEDIFRKVTKSEGDRMDILPTTTHDAMSPR